MKRQVSYAPKFKKIEHKVRQILLDYTKLTQEIESSMSGKRTEKEMDLLNKLKSESKELHVKTSNLLRFLFEE